MVRKNRKANLRFAFSANFVFNFSMTINSLAFITVAFFTFDLSAASDPTSFEELVGLKYKPNANYKIREFKEGSIQSLEGLVKSLESRSETNLKIISTLQEKIHKLPYSEKEQLVLGVAEIRKNLVAYLDKLRTYGDEIYQTNSNLEKMRTDLNTIEIEISNLKNLVGAWQTENVTAWE